MDACDPGSESVNIRRLVKLHTGKSVSISRDTACEILKLAKRGNSPLPPLSITRDKKYLLDAKSPLSQKDYEALFSSDVKLKDVKRIAKKAGLLRVDKTITELRQAIGRRLSSMNVREPVMLHKGSVEVIRNAAFNNNANANANQMNNLNNLNNLNNANRLNNNNNANRLNNNNNNTNANRNRNMNNVNRNRTNNKPKSGSNGLLGGIFRDDSNIRRSLAEKRHRERLQRTNSAFRPASMMVPTMRVINNQQRASLIAQRESEKINIELRNVRRQSEILEKAAAGGNVRAKQLLQESQKKISQLEAERKGVKVNATNAQKKINELEAGRKQNTINANAKAKKAAENAQAKINELNKNRLEAKGEVSKLQETINAKNNESRKAINEATRVATEAAKVAASANTNEARVAATKAQTELQNLIAATTLAREQNERNLKSELAKKNAESKAAIIQARAAAESAAQQAIKNQTNEAKIAAQKAKTNFEAAEIKANEQARKNALLLKQVQNTSTKLKAQITKNRQNFVVMTRQMGESVAKNKQESEAKITNLTRKISEAQKAYNNATKEGNKKAERAAAEAIQRIRAETNKKVKEVNKQLQLAVKNGNSAAIQVAKNNKKNIEQVKLLALPAPPPPNKKPLALPAPPPPNKKLNSTNKIVLAIKNAPTIPIARSIMLKSHSNKGGPVGVNMGKIKKAFNERKKKPLALPAPSKNNGIGKKNKTGKLNSIPNTKFNNSKIYNSNNNEPYTKKSSNPLFQTFKTTTNPLAEKNQPPTYEVGKPTINPLFKKAIKRANNRRNNFARAANVALKKSKAVGNVRGAAKAFTMQEKLKRNVEKRKAAEGAAESAKKMLQKESSKNKVAKNRERAKEMGISVKAAKRMRPRT